MAETGWPLIPREVLPAPVAAARRAKRMPVHVDGVRQLSIFGAETTEPSPADLAGLLAGPGRLGRMGGTARVSVAVDAAWRVHVLVGELVARGLVVSWLPIEAPDPQDQEPETDRDVRVAVAPDGDGDRNDRGADGGGESSGGESSGGGADRGQGRGGGADRGQGRGGGADRGQGRGGGGEGSGSGGEDGGGGADRGQGGGEGGGEDGANPEPVRAGKRPRVTGFEVRTAYSSRLDGLARAWPPPSGRLFLSGPRLRLWVAAAGEPRPGGYALGLDPVDNPEIADSALVRAGLAGTLSDQGPYYLISGKKRLRRLAELVGERPAAAPEQAWPGGAPA
jgi:hypothetical protein